MRDQYAGDVSDLLKFAFLRALAADDRTVGVGWYYNPKHDGLLDGRHREFCDEPKWESIDPIVLRALRELPGRSVEALEKSAIWPTNARFHRTPIPPIEHRHFWASRMEAVLREADIIFLDPDNGLGNGTERHATITEVAAMRKPGRSVVLIKFPGRKNHDQQIEEYHALLRSRAGASSVVTVRTCVSIAVLNKRGLLQVVPRVRWFTIIDPDDASIDRAKQFAQKLNEIEKCKAEVVFGSGNQL